MPEPLFFMMGHFEALIPTDRSYSPRHLWLQPTPSGTYRVGFTSYSVRMLQDVYFLEWSVDPGSVVKDRQEIGEIESSKAVSSMFPPGAGIILEFNPAILNDPSGINTDNYGSGWLYEFKPSDSMITAEEYVEVLQSGWDDTQRAIKGQINES